MNIRARVSAVLAASMLAGGAVIMAPSASAATCVSSMWRLNSKGTCVKAIQGLTRAFGSPTLAIDGVFGPKTDAAVRKTQTYFGLRSDGIVGPATWKILCAPQAGYQTGDTYEVPAAYPISWALTAGCPDAHLFHY